MDTLKIKNNSEVFTVYNSFVDNYIKDTNASFIKVYLYIARHSSDYAELSLDSIAESTGLLKSDVVSALKFWHKSGALTYTGDEVTIINPAAEPGESFDEPSSPSSAKKHPMPDRSAASSYKASGVIKAVTSDEKLAHLFAIIAQLLNKSLSSNDYKVIYSFIDYLKLPEQVIIVLIEYCVSMSKTNMRYIEKIAYSWADNGINTPELAIEYVKNQNLRYSVLSQYKKNFKISGRDFSDTEAGYILNWVNELNASEDLIMKAYDASVMNTGKVAFKYMDAVIKSELGYSAQTSAKKTLSSNIQKSTFRNYPTDNSVGDIEKQMIEKIMSQFGGETDAVNE